MMMINTEHQDWVIIPQQLLQEVNFNQDPILHINRSLVPRNLEEAPKICHLILGTLQGGRKYKKFQMIMIN